MATVSKLKYVIENSIYINEIWFDETPFIIKNISLKTYVIILMN